MDNIYCNYSYEFNNVPLRYDYAALEPFIDEKTMILHHDKHLQTYVNNLNAALKDYPEYHNWSLSNLIILNRNLPEQIRLSVMRNGGGVFNHVFYFNGMTDNVANKLGGEKIKQMLARKYGSMNDFKNEFKTAALSVFGSGYAYLVLNKGTNPLIITTKNQMTPLTEGFYPLLNIDVWEHAYYLKHYNNRAAYIDDWFNTINWTQIETRLNEMSQICYNIQKFH